MMCSSPLGRSKSTRESRGPARVDQLDDDDGTTLIELVVGMMVMTVFLAIFTAAIVAMNRAETKTEAVSNSASQLNQAFLTLDKAVRYAAAISQPGTGGSGDWYVELRTTNSGGEVCTQLRIDAQQLQRRTWTVTSAVGSAPTAWQPLTANISNGGAVSGANQPFLLVVPVIANDTIYQQLRFTFTSVSGNGSAQTTSLSSFTFTATNSTIPPPTGAICQEQTRP